MCIDAKQSLIALGVMIFISFIMYIRNIGYDRIFCFLLVAVSLIQFVEFLYHSSYIEGCTAGKAIFLILWLQVLVFALALYYKFRTSLVGVYTIFFGVVFLIAILYSVNTNFSVTTGAKHLLWQRYGLKEGNILGNSKWIYLAGLIVPLFIILYYNKWKETGTWILLGSIIFSIIFTKMISSGVYFPSMWCYSAIFIAFTAYLIGAFYCSNKE